MVPTRSVTRCSQLARTDHASGPPGWVAPAVHGSPLPLPAGNYFFYILCGPNENQISKNIINGTNSKKCLSFSEKTLSEIIPIMSNSDLYIGNDSFGHHVCSQSGIPSIILMLDTPSAYSDYSVNQHRVLPDGVNIHEVDHNSNFSRDQIGTDEVYRKALSLLS